MRSPTSTKQSKQSATTGIDMLRYAVTVAMAAAAIYLVGSLFVAITSDSLASPLQLQLNADEITSRFPSGATITEAQASVDVEAGLGLRLAWWAVTDALALVGLAFLELLRRILAKHSEPFTAANASRLGWMIKLAIVFACVDATRPIVSLLIQDKAGFDGFEATWDLRSLAVALILTALLEVWRRGVALRAEAELTI